MTRTPVKSSQIIAVGYDESTETLEIEFVFATYQYRNVPARIHRELMAADSVGRYFANNIKSKPDAFPVKKL